MKRVRYGNAIINELVERRLAELRIPDKYADHEVLATARDRRLLQQLLKLRAQVKGIERDFGARNLSVPESLTNLPTLLSRDYQWKQRAEKQAREKLAPLHKRCYALRAQAQADMLKAEDRPTQGSIIDALIKALEQVK